jgi:protein-disulfide isomerase
VRLEFHHFPLQQHAPGRQHERRWAPSAPPTRTYFWPFHDKVFQMISVEQQGGAT